ncbi:MAG TPA: glycosyltransferase family 2 protein [Candidatus Omnitrophica bacterium]|nr:glycosyltransferase family 2 protein [Candidatus Omnitrophota bacterium]
MNKVVLIPVYNGGDHIKSLLKKIKNYIDDIIVVDDGSTDNTAELAKEEGAIVLSHENNKGKGASLHTGIEYILDKNYDIIIIMDADGQHNPDEIPHFIQHYQQTNSPIILGNRMEDPISMPWIRRVTNRIMSIIISKICGQFIPDSQCGYKLIERRVFEKIKLYYTNYEVESEILIRAARYGFKIDSIPITTIYRQERSYINPIIDTLRFIRLLIDIKKDERFKGFKRKNGKRAAHSQRHKG